MSVSGFGMSGNKTPKGYSQSQIQQFTPEQMQLFSQMFGKVGPDSYLNKLASGDQKTFEQMEAPALQQFSGLQGNLASRFSGMGMGGRKSSGFQNTANQASSDFAQQLQSQRSGLQRQALQDLMSMSGQLFNQRPYEQSYQKKDQPFWQQMALGGVQALGQVGGAMATGGMSGLASAAGSAMKGAGKNAANFADNFSGYY